MGTGIAEVKSSTNARVFSRILDRKELEALPFRGDVAMWRCGDVVHNSTPIEIPALTQRVINAFETSEKSYPSENVIRV